MEKQNVNQVKLSDEDLAKIQKAVEDSRPKGYFEGMTQQISPKDAMQFVKENPEVLKLLLLKKGGKVTDENYDMLRGKIKEVKHHASELQSITNRKKQVPAWVLAKSTRASTDLSDITHYMDSQKFSGGGGVRLFRPTEIQKDKMKKEPFNPNIQLDTHEDFSKLGLDKREYSSKIMNIGRWVDVSGEKGLAYKLPYKIISLQKNYKGEIIYRGANQYNYFGIPISEDKIKRWISEDEARKMYNDNIIYYIDNSYNYSGGGRVGKNLHEKVKKLLGDISVNNHKHKRLRQSYIDDIYDNFDKNPDYESVLRVFGDYEINDNGRTIKRESIQAISKELELALKDLKKIDDGKMSKGGGVDAPSEEDARKELEKLKSEGKITLSVGNHGLIFMQIVKTGNAMVSSFKQSYESYLDALKHYYRVRNRFTEGGGVESASHIQGEIDDIRNWDNDEIANYIGVPISYVARDRNRYVREAQNYMMLNTFETGGNIGFKELSSRVAKRYQGKAVAPKYQSQYGKRYSKSEAREVGDKVAGKVYWQQQGRKFDGGGRIEVVLDEGNGKVINDIYNMWNNVKTEQEYKKWVEKVKNTKFGTYGTISFEEVMENFNFDNAPINSWQLKTFKAELKDALSNTKFSGGGGVGEYEITRTDRVYPYSSYKLDTTIESLKKSGWEISDSDIEKLNEDGEITIYGGRRGDKITIKKTSYSQGGGVSDEPSKYEVVLKGDRNYGKIGVTLNGWETDNRGRLYTTLSFDTGVSTYGEGEVEPINYSSRYTKDTYKNGGSVDGLSDLMYG